MTELVRFLDDNSKGRWANIRMDNGDPCWVGIAQTGILVKKSKMGIFGAKLFEEKDIYKAAKTAQILSKKNQDNLTPEEMWNPVLKSIVNTILHCSNLAEVTRVLNEAYVDECGFVYKKGITNKASAKRYNTMRALCSGNR